MHAQRIAYTSKHAYMHTQRLLDQSTCTPHTACGMALVALTVGVCRGPLPVRLVSSRMTGLTVLAGVPPAHCRSPCRGQLSRSVAMHL